MPTIKSSSSSMDIEDAMDLLDDDLPDGAYFVMLEELTEKDIGEIVNELKSK